MNKAELDKMGLSPQVRATLIELSKTAAIMGMPFDWQATASRLSAWESQSRMDAEFHRSALRSKAGHPAVKRRRS